jgi:ferric-dicitrate binding protein FerR (iron transport regulator)
MSGALHTDIELALGGDAASPALQRALAADPALAADWVAHRRLAVRLAALRPQPDLARRVRLVIDGRRPARRRQVARAVRGQIRDRAPSRAWTGIALAAAAALLLAVGGWWWLSPSAPVARADGRVLAVGSALGGPSPATVSWSDGTRAELAPDSAAVLTVDGLDLRRGRVACTVAPRGREPFRVHTPAGGITVVGTRFTIDLDAIGTRLAVAEGIVTAGGRTWGPGSRVRLRDGAAQAETEVWRWPGSGRLDIGREEAGAAVSGLWNEDGGEFPCIRIDLRQSPWGWRPGLSLSARIRTTDGGPLTLQGYAAVQRKNHAATAAPDPGDGWRTVTWDLDAWRPYDRGARIPVGATLADLAIVGARDAPPFTITDLTVTGPAADP